MKVINEMGKSDSLLFKFGQFFNVRNAKILPQFLSIPFIKFILLNKTLLSKLLSLDWQIPPSRPHPEVRENGGKTVKTHK
jgi:hypothetical protein